MKGNALGKRPKLHAPDPAYFDHARTIDSVPDGMMRTDGCSSIKLRDLVVLNPDDVTCYRCKCGLGRHPQYRNFLAAQWRREQVKQAGVEERETA